MKETSKNNRSYENDTLLKRAPAKEDAKRVRKTPKARAPREARLKPADCAGQVVRIVLIKRKEQCIIALFSLQLPPGCYIIKRTIEWRQIKHA